MKEKIILLPLTKEELNNIIYCCDQLEMSDEDTKLTVKLRNCYKEVFGENSKW